MKLPLAVLAAACLASCATATFPAPVRTSQPVAPPPAPPSVPAPQVQPQDPAILDLLVSDSIRSDEIAVMGVVSGVREHCGLEWEDGFVRLVQDASLLGYEPADVADAHGYYANQTKEQLAGANYACTEADIDQVSVYRPQLRPTVDAPPPAAAPAQPAPAQPRPEVAPTALKLLLTDETKTDTNAVVGIVTGVRAYCGLDWETGFNNFVDNAEADGVDADALADELAFYAEQSQLSLAGGNYACTDADIAELAGFDF